MKHWLANAIGFQLVWLAAVGGAARGWWWAGPLALSAFASIQLALSRTASADLWLMLGVAGLGFALDTLWVQSGLLHFSAARPWAQAAPVWIVALWMAFALTLNHSLAGLKTHPMLAATLGLIGGPLSYGAAERVGAVQLPEPAWIALGALALAWGLVTPFLLRLASGLNTHSLEAAR